MSTLAEPMHPLLEAATRASRDLLAALDAERAALIARDGAALEQAAAAKRIGADAVQTATDALARRLGGAVAAADADGLETYIAQAPASAQPLLRQASAELRVVAEQVRARNVANGRLLELGRVSTAWLLSALRGGAGETSVYGPDGTVPDASHSRALARA